MAATVDWDHQTVIGKKAKAPTVTRTESDVNGARRAGAVVATDKKSSTANKAHSGAAGPDHQRIAKLDRENEVAPPPKIAPSVGKAISTARLELKLTQKDLAQKINEKPSVLQDYESGKAIPNVQILAKMERVLGVKLRGNDIGKKLEGPGKKAAEKK
ncbi:ylMBF1 [Auriculariales sp. MPI-PUGE-AT-0066]|nr:ylMBF1 [Auriculariales sp. MPI-PUGE-AT-0066]